MKRIFLILVNTILSLILFDCTNRYPKINTEMRNPSSNIIIISIDDKTFKKLNIQWPFSRDIHANIINNISSLSPSVILFDIIFYGYSPLDNHLSKSFINAGNVYIPCSFVSSKEKTIKIHHNLYKRNKIFEYNKFSLFQKNNRPSWATNVILPNLIISKSVKGIGHSNICPNTDRICKTSPLIIKYKNAYYPSIDLLSIKHYYGIQNSDIEIKMGKYIKLKKIPSQKMFKPNKNKEITIPIDKNGCIIINYTLPCTKFQTYSYYDFYKKPNHIIKDKIVIIGSDSKFQNIEYKTPLGRLNDLYIHAYIINTILSQNFIK